MKKDNLSNREELKIGEELNFASREAYNLLKTNLSFSVNKLDEDKGFIIGLTSSDPQEGKSYTTINLAYSLAVDGNKVILLDCDMRKPTIAKRLSLKSSPGLSNLLVDKSLLNDAKNENVLIDNLAVISSGDIPPNPSHLVRSKEMNELLKNLAAEYDYVLLDLPPVNAVSDPIGISKFLDGILVVARHNYTRKKELFEAIRQLKFAEAKILGIVYRGYNHETKYYRRKGNGYYRYYENSNYYQEKNNK